MPVTHSKKVPYSGTTVAPEKTQADIQRMLYDFGAEGIQWTEVGMQLELKFVFTDEKKRPLTYRLRPPILTVPRRESGRRGSVRMFVDKAASMRLLHWYLKSKLEAVSYGLVDLEKEFLSNITGTLPSGEEVTVGDLIVPRIFGLGMADLAKARPTIIRNSSGPQPGHPANNPTISHTPPSNPSSERPSSRHSLSSIRSANSAARPTAQPSIAFPPPRRPSNLPSYRPSIHVLRLFQAMEYMKCQP